METEPDELPVSDEEFLTPEQADADDTVDNVEDDTTQTTETTEN